MTADPFLACVWRPTSFDSPLRSNRLCLSDPLKQTRYAVGFGLEVNMSSVVKVWTGRLKHWRQRVNECASILSADERECARRYLRREDQKRFVITRALTRRICAAHTGLEPHAVTFWRTSFGKPYLAAEEGHRKIEFNVSHSGDCLLIAWTEGGPVGVDVEALEPYRRVSFTEIASSAFSADECAVLSSVTAEETAATFYRVWVRKEALLKAEGCGVGGPLKSFSVAVRTPLGTRWLDEVSFPSSDRVWSIVELTPAPAHVAAVAVPLGAIVEKCTNFLE
jgi:4'-phosphopantetheinyl transferase